MAREYKFKAIEAVEKREGRPVKEILDEFEAYKTPLGVVAAKLRVHVQSVYRWRAQLGYRKRK